MASSSRGVQQDSFIDDDDNLCPLCIEEFDLSDRNFKPCPCGYQVCQFCFNNIKEHMNSLCPACRRPYDEKTMVWKALTPEEIAKFKSDAQKKAKKKADLRQKEAQKPEVDRDSRRHLVGIRVIQKNLVYVVGLSQDIPEPDLLKTLREPKYFGQYGNIIKIVVSKAKASDALGASLGVYVTFARKEEAELCIQAVNGVKSGERILRAQLGTTKYCSAFLRYETCTNKQCMFLHEVGDNDSSYSRQDLSSINSIGTQRPLSAQAATSSRQAAQLQAPLQHAQPISAASQPMAREHSKESADSGDGSALPSTANWGNKALRQRSRRGSVATSGTASSPAVSTSIPVPTEIEEQPADTGLPSPPQADAAQSSSAAATQSTHTVENSDLSCLINSIKGLNVYGNLIESLSDEERELLRSYPPLFDRNGGLKRRVMREQEEARLNGEQESQADLTSASDPQDEEHAPESGSGQLGGEPEDREEFREHSQSQRFLDSHRPSTQQPIQRATDGPFFNGNALQNLSQGMDSFTQLSGRNLASQQMSSLKSGQPSQSTIVDHFQPGMSHSGLYQNHSHGRQLSRFNFSDSSSSGKQSSASKIGQTTPFSQQQNQFYPGMQGPPPGLKSSGTPPIGKGAFGQTTPFVGSSSFQSNGKENSREYPGFLRGRGAITGTGQGFETGKREFMFSSFIHQYPSAFTPAPASGLASLYGSQPGASHDFSQTQKKKGKKHRHANTSSFGGGGLVDVADPNLMQQARMPSQQQQTNAGTGQGLYGGQGQDDHLLHFEEASKSVADLVDDPAESTTSSVDPASRSLTPVLPPGLPLPMSVIQSPTTLTEQIPKPSIPSRIVPTSAPFTPSRQPSSAYIPRKATPLSQLSLPPTPIQGVASPTAVEEPDPPVQNDYKTSAHGSGSAKEPRTIDPQLQHHDFPALFSGKSIPVGPKSMVSPKKAVVNDPPGASSRPNTKRLTPGILNVAAAAINSNKTSTEAAKSPVTELFESSAFPALPRSTPASGQISTVRPPKTLRITSSATKAEAVSTNMTAATSTPSTTAPATRPVSVIERAGTPVSETISDNVSIASTSMSRPGSPPPTRVGSAPLRVSSKNQQKKQRREAQKEKEKESHLQTVIDKPDAEENEIAPILGRKKKQKKEKMTTTTNGSTPATSRPQSPSPSTILEPEKVGDKEGAELNEVLKKQVDKGLPVKSTDDKGKNKVAQVISEPHTPTEEAEESADKSGASPQTVLRDLVTSGYMSDPKDLALFKASAFPHRPSEQTDGLQEWDDHLFISTAEHSELLAGIPVYKGVQNAGNRYLVTPNGDCLRNMNPAEERRYLELQKRILEQRGPTTFVPARHNASEGFSVVMGRAVPNGPPPYFCPLDGSGKAPAIGLLDKIQRDKSLSYINQFVLPPLSTNVQLERALNATAIDAESLRPGSQMTFDEYLALSLSEDGRNSDALGHSANAILSADISSHLEDGHHLGNVELLSVKDAEHLYNIARKETEKLEKSLNQLLKRNKRLLLGPGH